MKKKLNVEQIQSELRGGSAFFPGYKSDQSPISLPEERSEKAPKVTSRKKSIPAIESTDSSQGVPPGDPQGVPIRVPLTVPLIPKKPKRPIRQRQPFDIYEDQYQALKKIADTERGYENGRSMGQMVREALDAYLKSNNTSK
jgi:hypothetical protein